MSAFSRLVFYLSVTLIGFNITRVWFNLSCDYSRRFGTRRLLIKTFALSSEFISLCEQKQAEMLKVYILLLPLLCAASESEHINLQDVCPGTYCSLPDMKGVNTPIQVPNIAEIHLGFCRQLDVLRVTPQIRILSLANCGSDLFDKEDFWLNTELNKLQLHHSNITELRNDQFHNLYQLQILELGGNSIERMTNGTFLKLTLLEILGLQGNLLKSLPDSVFQPLESLRSLDLSDNNISIIPIDTFNWNLKLETLFLRGNPLTKLFISALGHSFFQLLDLSHCPQLKKLVLPSSVDTLILEESGVESLQFAGNKSLRRLQAANSRLTHVALNPISLIELDLSGTRLVGRNVSEVICEMRNLQRLDLSNNLIESLPLTYNSRDLCLLPSLRFLNLSHNRLVSLKMESAVFGPRLAVLDLSHNRLDSISLEALDAAHHLQSLSLAVNSLTVLNYRSLYERHRNLKELALFGNQFSSDLYNEMIEYFSHKDVDFIQKSSQWPLGMECPKPEKSKAKKHEWSVYDILIVIFLLGVLAYARMYLYRRAGGNCCFGCKWGQRTEDTSEARVRFLIRPESET